GTLLELLAERRWAKTEPAEPPPTMMKSYTFGVSFVSSPAKVASVFASRQPAYAYIRSNVIRTMIVPITHIHGRTAAKKRLGDWVPCGAGTAMVVAGIGCCRP